MIQQSSQVNIDQFNQMLDTLNAAASNYAKPVVAPDQPGGPDIPSPTPTPNMPTQPTTDIPVTPPENNNGPPATFGDWQNKYKHLYNFSTGQSATEAISSTPYYMTELEQSFNDLQGTDMSEAEKYVFTGGSKTFEDLIGNLDKSLTNRGHKDAARQLRDAYRMYFQDAEDNIVTPPEDDPPAPPGPQHDDPVTPPEEGPKPAENSPAIPYNKPSAVIGMTSAPNMGQAMLDSLAAQQKRGQTLTNATYDYNDMLRVLQNAQKDKAYRAQYAETLEEDRFADASRTMEEALGALKVRDIKNQGAATSFGNMFGGLASAGANWYSMVNRNKYYNDMSGLYEG